MALADQLPKDIWENYEIQEWRNAIAVLKGAHSAEWQDILRVLSEFKLLRSEVIARGGQKSPVARRIDSHFYRLGWVEKIFSTKIM